MFEAGLACRMTHGHEHNHTQQPTHLQRRLDTPARGDHHEYTKAAELIADHTDDDAVLTIGRHRAHRRDP
eukprot:31854-Eustigmatos_ZCMA.PRE.1